eukprot:7895319-Prorocentrum_lima.AAC.1
MGVRVGGGCCRGGEGRKPQGSQRRTLSQSILTPATSALVHAFPWTKPDVFGPSPLFPSSLH